MPVINTRYLGLLASCILTISLLSSTSFAAGFSEFNPPTKFPTIEFKDTDGKSHNVGEFKAKLTMVHFWATWCGPCVREFPQIDAIAKVYADQGLKVIPISPEGIGSTDRIVDFFNTHNISHLTPYVDDGSATYSTAVRGLPTTFFIRADGKAIAVAEGPLRWDNDEVKAFLKDNLK